MKKAILILWGIALALAVIAGCSTDQTTAPPRSDPAYRAKADRVVGPSKIVLAIDVSSFVSADDLTALVGAAKSALSNGDLVPDDGSISVAAIVYGDTIASAFPGFVAVTSENLTNVILPGLTGLETDRLVTGTKAGLARAMDAARDLLAPALVSDRHLLVLGSGAVADTMAMAGACAALDAAHVMVSAVTLGASHALAGCVAASGGFFAGSVTNPTLATAQALAYMLEVDLTLVGSATHLPRHATFTATADLFRGGDPVKYPLVNDDVTFQVIRGPNSGDPVTEKTDTLGLARFSYVGEGAPGTDVILAKALHPGSGRTLADSIEVTWDNILPTCDAGGPYAAVALTDTVRLLLDGSHSSDADGDSLRFHWSVDCDGAIFVDPTSVKPLLILTGDCLCSESLTVTLVVGDGFGTSTCEAGIAIDDRRPPVIVVRPDPLVLWPPNHKYTTYTPGMFVISATDACGRPINPATTSVVLAASSDEPDDALGDGRTINDIKVTCPNATMLRAERMGGGDGRLYTIVYRFVVGNSLPTDVTVHVAVPHDSSSDHVGEDHAGGFTVTPDCNGRNNGRN